MLFNCLIWICNSNQTTDTVIITAYIPPVTGRRKYHKLCKIFIYNVVKGKKIFSTTSPSECVMPYKAICQKLSCTGGAATVPQVKANAVSAVFWHFGSGWDSPKWFCTVIMLMIRLVIYVIIIMRLGFKNGVQTVTNVIVIAGFTTKQSVTFRSHYGKSTLPLLQATHLDAALIINFNHKLRKLNRYFLGIWWIPLHRSSRSFPCWWVLSYFLLGIHYSTQTSSGSD